MSTPPLVRLRSASFGYADRTVVSEVDLAVHEREVVALLGPERVGQVHPRARHPRSECPAGRRRRALRHALSTTSTSTPASATSRSATPCPRRCGRPCTEIVRGRSPPPPPVVEARDARGPRHRARGDRRRGPGRPRARGGRVTLRRTAAAGAHRPRASPGGPTCSSWTSRRPASTTPARRRWPSSCSDSPTGARRCSSCTHELAALDGVVNRIVCLDAGHVDFDGTPAAYAQHLQRHAVGSDHHHPDDDAPRRGHVIGAAPLDPAPGRWRRERPARPRLHAPGAARGPAGRLRGAARRGLPRAAPDVAHRRRHGARRAGRGRRRRARPARSRCSPPSSPPCSPRSPSS